MRTDVTIGEVLILVSSPGRITPYHMDSETNFLLQVTGSKPGYATTSETSKPTQPVS